MNRVITIIDYSLLLHVGVQLQVVPKLSSLVCVGVINRVIIIIRGFPKVI